MDFHAQLLALLHKTSNAPFLFVGSGFSRRYIGTESWDALLRRFCICGKDFEYYRSTADGELPRAAAILADDFHELWWTSDGFKEKRHRAKHLVLTRSDALKLEISEYLRSAAPDDLSRVSLSEEIDILQKTVIDGIITTNWDKLLERIFPDYRPFIGQDSILCTSPTGIAEIYKIHGCCTDHRTLVLTETDYAAFNERNHYLAAKLVTTFIEHPVIFIGYSLEDKNIQAVLGAIVRCLGKTHIGLLQDRLLFLDWNPAIDQPRIEQAWYKADDATIPLTKIRASSFTPVYEALAVTKRKIPTRVLRYLKEQVVELASTEEPKTKVSVIDIDERTALDKVEFVVGIGLTKRALSPIGYSSILPINVIEDFLFLHGSYDPEMLVKVAYPRMLKLSPNLPIFYYLKQLGITDKISYGTFGKGLDVGRAVDAEVWKHSSKAHDRHRSKLRGVTFDALVAMHDEPHRVLDLLQFLDPVHVSPGSLRSYLQKHFDPTKSNKTDFRKAVCILDRLENGWSDLPSRNVHHY